MNNEVIDLLLESANDLVGEDNQTLNEAGYVPYGITKEMIDNIELRKRYARALVDAESENAEKSKIAADIIRKNNKDEGLFHPFQRRARKQADSIENDAKLKLEKMSKQADYLDSIHKKMKDQYDSDKFYELVEREGFTRAMEILRNSGRNSSNSSGNGQGKNNNSGNSGNQQRENISDDESRINKNIKDKVTEYLKLRNSIPRKDRGNNNDLKKLRRGLITLCGNSKYNKAYVMDQLNVNDSFFNQAK